MNTSFSATSPGGSPATSLLSRINTTDEAARRPKKDDLELREKFQDFAAGTFYKEMLKALRQGQKHSKYFYGGQAEEIFRGQMDQQVAENLARQHGGGFAGPLYDAYSKQSSSASTEQGHALDAVA